MKLYVPEIGDQIKLTKEWNFTLHQEGRNAKVYTKAGYYASNARSGNPGSHVWTRLLVPADKVKPLEERLPERIRKIRYERERGLDPEYLDICEKFYKEVSANGVKSLDFIFPKDTVLQIDRIYIRKGQGYSQYSSITFVVVSCKEKKYNKTRFWAKLEECNRIEFEKVTKGNIRSEGIYWQYTPPNLSTGIIIPDSFKGFRHFSSGTSRPAFQTFYGFTEDYSTKVFEVSNIKKIRPATQQEIDEFNQKQLEVWGNTIENNKEYYSSLRGSFSKPPKPTVLKEANYVEYNKYHVIHIASGVLVGKYTAVESYKTRCRKVMKTLNEEESEVNLFTV